MRPLTFDRFATLQLFTAIACAACLMPAQNDTWWHLRAGQVIVDSRSIPLQDLFSHTVNGGYWPDHEWLSQVVFYLLYALGGLPLLTAFAALVVTAAWFIVWQLTPGSTLLRLTLSVLALASTVGEWSLRPQIFTLFFLALTARELVRRRYVWLPLIFLIWANLHGGVTLGVLLVGAAALQHMIVRRTVFDRALVVMGVSLLATVVTPLDFELWRELPGSLARLRAYGVQEWRAPGFDDPTLWPFWLLAAAFVVTFVCARPWQRTIAGDVLIWGSLVLAPSALSVSRNVPALEIALVPSLGQLMMATGFGRAPAARIERPRANAVLAAVAVAVAVAVVVYAWAKPIDRLRWRPVSPDLVAAVRACQGPLYNRYDDGGYLIWFAPDVKVFIDSRQDPYPPELVHEHIAVETSGEYEALFDRYRIQCALGPADSLVSKRLAEDGWNLAFTDGKWTVLSRS